MCSDGDDVTCAGSPFQTRAAETGKANTISKPIKIAEKNVFAIFGRG